MTTRVGPFVMNQAVMVLGAFNAKFFNLTIS